MNKIVSTNPAKNYKVLGEVKISTNAEIATKVKLANHVKEIKAGSVDINGMSHFKPFNPFGGYKDSGMGREHGRCGLQELCQIKVLSMSK